MRKVTVALAAAVAALAAAGHAHAATPQTFSDPTGDSGTAPDITQVAVSNDQLGQYEFDVSFATDYGPNAEFSLYVDADQNPADGDPTQDGADFAIVDDHASHTFDVEQWSGTDWESSPHQTASFKVMPDNRSVIISINKSELGNTSAFDFFTLAGDGASTDAGAYDDAPSGTGTFAYTYQVQKLALSFVTTRSVVKGRMWSVAAAVRRSDTNALQGNTGTIGCHSKLPVLMQSWVTPAGGSQAYIAVCVFQLPKQKHVPVSASMTIGADGATATKTLKAKS